LLWALLTDPRTCAQRIGRLLASEFYHVRLAVAGSASTSGAADSGGAR